MKLTSLFLLLGMSMIWATNADSQTARVNIQATNVQAKEIINQIEEQTDYLFVYNYDKVDLSRKLTLHASNTSVAEVLAKMFEHSDVIYAMEGNNILLMKRNESLEKLQNAKRITGTVTDAHGEAIIGVNVIEKGTVNGITTDMDGNFALEVGQNAVLTVSYIGYASREINVGNQRTLRIQLTEDSQALEEIVVVGYGSQKKSNLTGAVTSVSGDKMAKRPVSNTSSMLQGVMSGVQIVQGSGEPGGEGISIQIRGKGTFSSAGSNPLILINGIQGNIENVNPNDIESVSVLKDAASAAIYGSQAANGVILITTKSGTAGKMNINVRASYAMKTATFLPKLITNSAEYMELYNEASINSGITDPNILYTQETINQYRNATDRVLYPNTDWLDIIFDPAPTQNYYVGVNGGNEKTQYNLSIDYIDDQGIMKGYNFHKINAMLNLNSQIHERVRLNAIINLNTSTKVGTTEGGQDQVIAALSQSPLYGPKLPDGSGRYVQKAFSWEYVNKNPVAQIEQRKRTDDAYGANAQLGLDIKLAKYLVWTTKGGINVNFNKYDIFSHAIDLYNWRSRERVSKGTTGGATRQISQTIYSTLFSHLTYEKAFGSSHNFKAQVGYSMESNNYQFVQGRRRNYDIELITELNAGSADIQYANGNQEDWALMSYFGRLNYNFQERYLLEANLRYDGSSRLSPKSRWGAFPSFSAAWRTSSENFVKNMDLTWLDNFKIRASYGSLGNQNIGLYPYQALLSMTSYSFDNQTLATAAAQTVLNNPNIKWETTSMLDIGLDLSVLNGLSLTFDWYKKRTSDILRGSQVTGVVGLDPPTVNDGILENTGIDLELAYNGHVKSGALNGLNYNVGLTLEHYKNKLVKFGQREIDRYSIRQEGEEYDAFYMLKWIGIFQTKEEIANSPKQYNDATIPGDLKWEDVNKDGVVNNDDRVVIPGRYPKLNYGLNLSANWKSFDVYALFQGVYGVKFFLEKWAIVPFSQGSPPTLQWRDRWTEENPSTTVPRMYYQGWESAPDRFSRTNSWFLRDASYFRMKNISVGYTVPTNITRKIGLNKVRVFFSGDNLFTLTKYRDLDPERTTNGYNANYTQNKIFSLGLDVQL